MNATKETVFRKLQSRLGKSVSDKKLIALLSLTKSSLSAGKKWFLIHTIQIIYFITVRFGRALIPQN